MSKGRHMHTGRTRKGFGRFFSPLVLVVCGFLFASAGAAYAYWSASGSGNASATATTLGAGNQPTATVSGRDVTLSWGAFTNATSYTVARSNVAPQNLSTTLIGSCATPPTGTSCADTSLPENGTSATNWTYTDTPNVHNWLGVTSSPSSTVIVPAPTLSMTTTSFTTAGGTTSATVANYFDSETAYYCVDNDVTTSCPSGDKASPASASVPPSGGTLTTSLTIPSGLSLGTHTLYAKGSSGSNPAGVTFTVSNDGTGTLTTATSKVSASSTGNTITFTYTAAFAMTSGEVDIAVPAGVDGADGF